MPFVFFNELLLNREGNPPHAVNVIIEGPSDLGDFHVGEMNPIAQPLWGSQLYRCCWVEVEGSWRNLKLLAQHFLDSGFVIQYSVNGVVMNFTDSNLFESNIVSESLRVLLMLEQEAQARVDNSSDNEEYGDEEYKKDEEEKSEPPTIRPGKIGRQQ